ncbi:MAG TPA: hypothetical protein PLY68_07055 [Myxococcota bacterium]|nr:hypothetical protein [Myxococcota bacterium]HNZ04179.1 hypothetical protein [Myxococcota bacterium]HOD08102.1 hypothetical protein [Myxococcota bacterium]HPB51095.1 hypothetical protein [Myxococcota bacterium]HQP95940.1 hypothetical protein [Myxococcota bacterium]
MTRVTEKPSIGARRFLLWLVVVNLTLAAVTAVVFFALAGWADVPGVAAGGLIGTLNLSLLGSFVMMVLAPQARRIGAWVMMGLQFAGVVGALLLALLVFKVEAVGLAVGFSTSVLTVIGCSAFVALSGRGIDLR